MSQITTHILDTSIGKPASGIVVELHQSSNDKWITIAKGLTNSDGRVIDLLKSGNVLEKGNYRLLFETKQYFFQKSIQSFYPRILIEFEITDASHYHVPLLLNPFGYSTYRGS